MIGFNKERRAARKAARKEAQRKRGPFMRFAHDWIFPLVIAAAVLTPIRSSVADWNDVPTGSMRPTILEGDRIFVNKLAYGLRVPLTKVWIAHWGAPQRGPHNRDAAAGWNLVWRFAVQVGRLVPRECR